MKNFKNHIQNLLTPARIIAFQNKILQRYDENKREWLPRRDSFDQYKVLVSETMLQQTQVDRVIPKFQDFIEQLPSLQDLAQTDKTTLLRLWSWLWFNSRAIRLQQSAQIIIDTYHGVLPKEREILRRLPWIWSYCSASLLAFVYNIDAPVVDTNIRRVFIAELGIEQTMPLKWLETVALLVSPSWKANDRNNALMDYGACVATVAATWIKPRSKQSPFAWSNRQIRWRIMKYLIEHNNATYKQLSMLFMHKNFDTIVQQLLVEWLIVKKWNHLSIE